MKLRAKLLAIFSLVLSTITPAVSQEGPGILSTGPSFGLSGVVNLLDQLVLFRMQTPRDVAIFLVIFFGAYFASSYFIQKVIELIDTQLGENIDALSSRSVDPMEEHPWVVRGLSLGAAYLTTTIIGFWFAGTILIGIALMALLGFFNGMRTVFSQGTGGINLGIGDLFGGGDQDQSGANPGGTATGEGDTEPATDGGAAMAEVSSEIGELGSEISDIHDRLDQIEGEDQQLTEELQALRSDVENLEEFEQRLPKLVEEGKLTQKQAEEVKKIVEEAESLEQLEEKIESNEKRLLKAEEKIESNVEDVEELEEQIEALEEATGERLSEIRQEVQDLNGRKERIKQELRQLEMELENGAVDREQYEAEKQELESQLETVKNEVSDIKNKLSAAAEEREKIKQRINGLESMVDGNLSITGDLEERVEQLEQEESQAEQMEGEEEKELSKAGSGFPDQLAEIMKKDIGEEGQVLQQEEKETQDLESVLEELEHSTMAEREIAGEEETISEKLDQEFLKLGEAAKNLEWEVEQEVNALQQVDKQEQREIKVEEQGVREILAELRNLSKGKVNASPERKQEVAEDGLERLRYLENHTQDQTQLEMINRAKNYAKQLIQQDQTEMAEERQLEGVYHDLQRTQNSLQELRQGLSDTRPQQWDVELRPRVKEVAAQLRNDVMQIEQVEASEHGERQENELQGELKMAANIVDELMGILAEEARGAPTQASTHLELFRNELGDLSQYSESFRNSVGDAEYQVQEAIKNNQSQGF